MEFTIEARDAARLIAALADAASKGKSFDVEIDDDGFIYVGAFGACRVKVNGRAKMKGRE